MRDGDWRSPTKRVAGAVAHVLHRCLGTRAPDALGILVYHRVAQLPPGVPPPTINVRPERFRAQLEGLLTRGYAPWPLRRVLATREAGEPIPPRVLVVTFDDAFDNVYTEAWPILRSLHIPATVFVSTAYLDASVFPFDPWGCRWQSEAPPDTYRPLTAAHCAEMIEHGLVEIGAHTHTHQDFRGRASAFEDDLGTCVRRLRHDFGLRDVSFAFPFGRPHLGFVTPALVAAARRTGVTCGLTTRNEVVDVATDPFTWGRFNAFDWDSADVLAAKLAGWYGWAPGLQELVGRLAAGDPTERRPDATAADGKRRHA